VTESSPTVGLIALIAHARSVPSEAREAFGDAAARVAHDPRAILVRTCHRIELYVAVDPGCPPVMLPEAPAGTVRHEGLEAARHMFTVAAGLDSVVVGEDQILHQLRDCLSDRHVPAAAACPVEIGSTHPSAMSLHPLLERAFQLALHLGRETRSWREGPPLSLADVALDRARPATGPLLDKRVLVVGAGRMARLCALASARQGARVLVANRSSDRAAALAHDASGEPAPFGPDAVLPEADLFLLAIGAQWPLSTSARADLLAGTQPVVDLSSPPALDDATRMALGERYTSIDDLARNPQTELHKRMRVRYERLLADAEQNLLGWVRSREHVPAIQALSDHAETRRAEELDRLFRRLELADNERDLVEQMTHRLVAGLIHRPLANLRDDQTGELDRAARSLFSL
jgi:glutamyl-tRNA reductase